MLLVATLWSSPAFAQPAEERMRALVTGVTAKTGWHPNDRWPDGIDPDAICAANCQRGRTGVAQASIVRDEKHHGSWVVLELHVYVFETQAAANDEVKRMNDVAFGPYAKHPYRVLRPEPTVVVTVEGRFRFPRYLDELSRLAAHALGLPPPRASAPSPRKAPAKERYNASECSPSTYPKPKTRCSCRCVGGEVMCPTCLRRDEDLEREAGTFVFPIE